MSRDKDETLKYSKSRESADIDWMQWIRHMLDPGYQIEFSIKVTYRGCLIDLIHFGTVRSRLLSENPQVTDFIPSGNDF